MKVLIIIFGILIMLFITQLDERLLYVETYLRQILDLLHELKNKNNGELEK